MAMIIHSKIFISEGRGQPVSLMVELKVKIDGCSDHGRNHDILAGIWKDTLKKRESTITTAHYEVETTTEIVNQSDYYFILGERIKLLGEMAAYRQDLYAIRASGSSSSRSLERIQEDLFSSELFEGSEVNQNAFILPTDHAKKVVNRLIIFRTAEIPYNEEHYRPGSFFRICRYGGETSDTAAEPVSHDVVEPCNDVYESNYLAEMRHVSKAAVPMIPQPMRPAKSMNPNLYVAAPNTDNVAPMTEENGHKTPAEEVVDYQNDANAFEERGSHSVSADTTPKGALFTSANTNCDGDERVVMTPLKDVNEHMPIAPQSVSVESLQTLFSSSECDQRGPGFSFNTHTIPMNASTSYEPGNLVASATIAEEEVFEQDVPPTPVEPKRHHFSAMDDNQQRRIDNCLQESIDVEPVEEKSCESNPLGGKVTEAGIDLPLRSQQQCLDDEDQALVIPTLKSSHKPVVELDHVKRRLYEAPSQQSKQPVIPGVTQQPINSNCYTPDNRPVQASQQQQQPRQQLHSQSFWPGHQPPQQQYHQQHSVCMPGMASVPNILGQPPVKYGHFGRERTTTGPNACSPMQSTAFSRYYLNAFVPLEKGKVIYSAKPCFKEGTNLQLQQLEDDKCEIGSGGNGSVFLYRCAGECFAVKKTEYRPLELSWWSRFDHPNVIPLLAVAISDYYVNCISKSTCWQVMPQMEGDLSLLVDYGTLESIRDKKPEHNWMTAYSNTKHVLKKTLCAMEYLHRLGIVHRDIKERNVFYKMCCEHGLPYECECPSPRKCEVKLGDFDALSIVQSHSNHVLGTKNYRSPEMLSKENVSSTVDIYAFGCMVIKLIDGRKTYKTESEGICKVVKGPDFHQHQYLQELLNMRFKFENILMSKFEEISAIGKFIKDCINSVPDERPSAAALLKDPFFHE